MDQTHLKQSTHFWVIIPSTLVRNMQICKNCITTEACIRSRHSFQVCGYNYYYIFFGGGVYLSVTIHRITLLNFYIRPDCSCINLLSSIFFTRKSNMTAATSTDKFKKCSYTNPALQIWLSDRLSRKEFKVNISYTHF